MFVRDRMKEKFLYVYTHLKAAGKGWAFMQETYDPFNPAEKVGLYRYDVCQSMDLTKGK